MDSELEQQLMNFLLDNRDYNRQFIVDLVNILKCHLGTLVKRSYSQVVCDYDIYYSVTTNFRVYVMIREYYWKTHIIYKLRKFSYGNSYNIYQPIFSHLCKKEYKYLRNCYLCDNLYEFINHIKNDIKPLNHDVNVEWLFTTNQVKSARNINQLDK